MTHSTTITTCPSCRDRTLTSTQLEPLLPSHRCGRCGGHWLRGEEYFRWLNHPDRKQNEPIDAVAGDQVRDSTRAMLCPECGKLLSRYRVGHGLTFFIDHCAGCGGVWLDVNEWEALKRAQLDGRVHRIFSAAWQAQILRDEQRHAAEHRLSVQIGR